MLIQYFSNTKRNKKTIWNPYFSNSTPIQKEIVLLNQYFSNIIPIQKQFKNI